MKFKIKKEEILKGLQRIQGVVEKKNTMPILSNLLLIADDRGVEIIATDLEIGLRGDGASLRRREIDPEMVFQLVSVPPSQRELT